MRLVSWYHFSIPRCILHYKLPLNTVSDDNKYVIFTLELYKKVTSNFYICSFLRIFILWLCVPPKCLEED